MSIGIRHYIFPDGGPTVRLSDRVVSGLIHGADALPLFANSRQKLLTAFLDLENSKPVRIYKTEGSIWSFDDEGDITEGMRETLGLALASVDFGTGEDADTKVVSIDRKLKRKRLFDEHRWEPTSHELDVIARDIWPKTKADRLQIINGVAKRRPSMTWDAEQALRECAVEFHKFGWAISKLKEPSLKAFEFEARRRSKEGAEHPYLYTAMADMALEELEILKRRRKNKGTWFATIDVVRWTDDTGDTAMSLDKRCESRKEAEAAARALLIENAKYFSFDTTVEVSVLTDLEWKQRGGKLD